MQLIMIAEEMDLLNVITLGQFQLWLTVM